MIRECVQCGYCCTIGVCPYGKWDGTKGTCRFLTDESQCDIYNEIIAQPEAEYSPAFGAGCSSTIGNKRRNDKLQQRRLKRSPV